MLHRVGLSLIIDTNKHLGFDIGHNCNKWTQNGPLYNKTICSQSSGHNFEDYFTTGRKERYELLCDVYAYKIFHSSGPDNASIGVGIPLKST